MVVNATKISKKMKNKSQLSVEKYIMKREKIIESSLDKVSVSSYKSKDGISLEQPRLLRLRLEQLQCNLRRLKQNTLNFSIRR